MTPINERILHVKVLWFPALLHPNAGRDAGRDAQPLLRNLPRQGSAIAVKIHCFARFHMPI